METMFVLVTVEGTGDSLIVFTCWVSRRRDWLLVSLVGKLDDPTDQVVGESMGPERGAILGVSMHHFL